MNGQRSLKSLRIRVRGKLSRKKRVEKQMMLWRVKMCNVFENYVKYNFSLFYFMKGTSCFESVISQVFF